MKKSNTSRADPVERTKQAPEADKRTSITIINRTNEDRGVGFVIMPARSTPEAAAPKAGAMIKKTRNCLSKGKKK